MNDSETATFVLAYLLKSNYSQTANTFLQECKVLPCKSFLILPETPLQNIISEHKSRADTNVLLNTLGPVATWKALWDKLHSTLQQIRVVHEEGSLSTHHVVGTKITQQQRPNPRRKTRPQLASQISPSPQPLPTTPTHPPPGTPPPYAPLLEPPSLSLPTMSPHRRKPVPKRKEPAAISPARAPPLSPGTQHVLDSLMEDNQLPGKLADIINRCVSKDDMTSDLSPLTLDSIIDQTYSDPALEGLIGHVTIGSDHVISEAEHVTEVEGKRSTEESEHVQDAMADHVTDHVTTVQDHVTESPPTKKYRRMEDSVSEPTEQDIDAFLDKLHS